ncbi:uncharacterized protein TNCV_3648321 [Trichonephila clavipes]|nr:uncharacterized protein TNCV_3648321 [Trichonephila clavipes]
MEKPGKSETLVPTSREDDRLGVVDKVLAFGTEGTQNEPSFLRSHYVCKISFHFDDSFLEDERGLMPTSAIKDLLKKWEDVRAMVLKWHPNQADVSRVRDLYNDNANNYFRKILKKREKQSTLDMFFNAP